MRSEMPGEGWGGVLTPCFSLGVLRRPSISAQPSSLVHAGASVTLCCHSRLIFDTFILHREGGTQYSQQHREKFPGGHSQARFSMGPLTPAHGGTYRCYGALSHAPQEWSAPSDPVDVTVTGERGRPAPVLLVPGSLWGDGVLQGQCRDRQTDRRADRGSSRPRREAETEKSRERERGQAEHGGKRSKTFHVHAKHGAQC